MDAFLPGLHQIHIAADCIDFSVMQNVPIRVRPIPAGRRIRRKAAVHQSNGAAVVRALQIIVKFPKLRNQEHALVNNGPARKRADIGIPAGLLKNPADDIQAPIKGKALRHIGRPAQEALQDYRHAVPCLFAQDFRMYRYASPAKKFESFLFRDALQHPHGLRAGLCLPGKENHADAVVPGVIQRDA